MYWLGFFLSGFLAFSQGFEGHGERPDNPEYLAHSRLVTIRVVPAGKSAQIFIAGNRAADLDFKNTNKLLQITAVSPNRRREVLEFQPNGQSYVVPKLPDWEEGFQLYVKTESRGKVEETKIPIKSGTF